MKNNIINAANSSRNNCWAGVDLYFSHTPLKVIICYMTD